MPFLSSSYFQKLVASDAASGDLYGVSVAISADGTTAVVGAQNEDTSPNTNQGAVYVYTLVSGVWTQQAKLLVSPRYNTDAFGFSVALSANGNRLAVGAVLYNGGYSSVIVFNRDAAGTWSQQQIVSSLYGGFGPYFGKSIAISGDGNALIIVSDGTYELITEPGYEFEGYAGAGAHVYRFLNNSWSYTGDTFLYGASSVGAVTIDYYGNRVTAGFNSFRYYGVDSGWVTESFSSIPVYDGYAATTDEKGAALSADGNTLILGNYTEGGTPGGAAYVYTYTGSSWALQQRIVASDVASSDYFGHSVAISSDGNTAIIGAVFEDTSPSSNNGAAYVFTRSGSTWTQQQKIISSDLETDSYYGDSVAISGDGTSILVGSSSESTSPLTDNGAVHAYYVDQVPSQPIITTIESGATQLVVNFTPPATNASFITNYQYSTDNGATFTTLNPASTTSPITITGLASNSAFVVVIRGINSSGNAGTSSNTVVGFTSRTTAPTITGVTVGNAQLTVAFTAPSFTGGSAITNYQYSIAENTVVISSATVSSNIATITTSTAHAMVTGDSVNVFNLTANSEFQSFTVLSTPTSTTYTVFYVASNGSLTLGSSPTSTGSLFVALDPVDTTSPIIITGLTNEQPYLLKLRAVNSNGPGLSSANFSGTPSAIPSAPVITSITPSNQTLSIGFNAPSYDGGNAITDYEYSLDDGLTFTSVGSTSSPIVVGGLDNGSNYFIVIRAFNELNYSPISNSISGSPATTPDAPTISNITPSNKELIVSIIPPLYDGDSSIINYQYSLNGGNFISALGNPITIRELVNKTTYSVVVRALNAIGAGQSSDAVSGTPNSVDRAINALSKALAKIHPDQNRYNFAPKLEGDIRILLEDQNNYLTLNNLDNDEIIWVVSDIDGWWNLAEPSIPDIERGFGDGSFDVTGRNLARNLTLTGSILITDFSRETIAAKSASARSQLLNAFNLVKRGTWLIVDEDEYKRAAFVRLSGRPEISTVNSKGRIEFSIGLKAADPIKYEWIDGEDSNIPQGQPFISNGYNLKIIGEVGYSDTAQDFYSKYGNTDLVPATDERYREYSQYGNTDLDPTTDENFREYSINTFKTGISGAVTVENYGDTNVYCLFRIIGPLYGPAEILNKTTNQKIPINGPIAPNTQILLPDTINTTSQEFLDIDTRIREVRKGDFINGEQEGSSRGLLDPIVDWIYLAPGPNTIIFNDYGSDAITSTPQLQIFWRSGWLG